MSVWNGKTYDRTPFSVKRNLCDYFKYDYKYLKAGFANSNIPTSCPVKKVRFCRVFRAVVVQNGVVSGILLRG